MLHQTLLFLGQLWQLFEVSQILEFLRYFFSTVFEWKYAKLFVQIYFSHCVLSGCHLNVTMSYQTTRLSFECYDVISNDSFVKMSSECYFTRR